jgi:hypothetical protein
MKDREERQHRDGTSTPDWVSASGQRWKLVVFIVPAVGATWLLLRAWPCDRRGSADVAPGKHQVPRLPRRPDDAATTRVGV